MLQNPFKPTAGKTPPMLIGRDSILNDFSIALDDGVGAPERLMFITGSRGSGKTVILNAIGEIASNRGWLVINETARKGFVSEIIKELQSSHKHLKSIHGPSLTLSAPLGVTQANISTGTAEFTEETASYDLRKALTAKMKRMNEKKHGILITVDEIQSSSMDEIRALAVAFQHMIREDHNVALVLAGLPSAVEETINDEVITFMRRAERKHLGNIDLKAVRESFSETITSNGKRLEREALTTLASATAGYPFMVQLVGYWAWRVSNQNEHEDTITADDALMGIDYAKNRLETLVHSPEFHKLSIKEQEFLIAMAEDEQSSSVADIAARMKRAKTYVNVYRTRLMAQDVIYSPRRGYIDFKIPYMREYVRNQTSQWAMEHLDENDL